MRERLQKMGLTKAEFDLASKGRHAKLKVNKSVIDYLNLQTQIAGIIYQRGELKAETEKNKVLNGNVTLELVKDNKEEDNQNPLVDDNVSGSQSAVPEEQLQVL